VRARLIKGAKGRDVMVEVVNGTLTLTVYTPSGGGPAVALNSEQAVELLEAVNEGCADARRAEVAAIQRALGVG
jgi:hypothetical protein